MSLLKTMRELVGSQQAFRGVSIDTTLTAPCKGGGQTTYTLTVEKRPSATSKGQVKPFPSANFGLATVAHQEEVRRMLEERDYILIT